METSLSDIEDDVGLSDSILHLTLRAKNRFT